MSKFLPPAEPQPSTPPVREFWTVTATWMVWDRVEQTDRLHAETLRAESLDELHVITRRVCEKRGEEKGFELLQEHHPDGRRSYRITETILTPPGAVSARIAGLRDALKRKKTA